MSDLAAASAAPLPRVNLYLAWGAALTLLAIAVAVLGLVYSPYAPSQVDLLRRLAPPSAAHPLGTDRFGRDVLSRVLAGGWRSINLGFGATALGLAIGLPIALLTGLYRGRLDQVVMRLVDALRADPRVTSIVGVARRAPQRPLPDVEFRAADIVRDSLEPIFAGADVVVHLGGGVAGALKQLIHRRDELGDAARQQVLDLAEIVLGAADHLLEQGVGVAQPLEAVRVPRQERKIGVPLFEQHAVECQRERQVAQAVCEGLTDNEIARRMGVGLPTVRTYLRRIFDKLGIERRSALAAWSRR